MIILSGRSIHSTSAQIHPSIDPDTRVTQKHRLVTVLLCITNMLPFSPHSSCLPSGLLTTYWWWWIGRSLSWWDRRDRWKSWVELQVNHSMEAGNDSLSTTVAWCTSYITVRTSRRYSEAVKGLQHAWQSLIGSVWGLQDLFVVIIIYSNVQRHNCCRVHVTAIKVSLPIVRNTAAVTAAVWYTGSL